MVAGEDRKWKAQPVTVAKADAATLAKLVANKGRTGMRLINLWSTSCGPCVAEFPELVKIYRQYSWQEFEFIPISLDPVGDRDKVERFLKRVHCGLSPRTKPLLDEEERTTNNYLFDGDTEDLAKAIDSKWDGALPYTLLVGKDGEVLFRHSGVIDPLALRKKIVEQVWKKSAE
jgi:thiol-disulfide isomerase/thioredoxin